MSGAPLAMSAALRSSTANPALQLANNQLLQDTEHVFNPKLTAEDKRSLNVLAQVAGSLADKTLNPKKFSSSLKRKQWAGALQAVEDFSKQCGVDSKQVFSALLGLAYAPVCQADIFAIAAVKGINERIASQYQTMVNSDVSGVWRFVAQTQTREKLLRFAVYGAVLWSQRPTAFDLTLSDEVDRNRFQRFAQVVQLVAKNNAAYTRVMDLANQEKWKEADQAASEILEQADIRVGTEASDPPAIADFLLLALIPAGEPTYIASFASSQV